MPQRRILSLWFPNLVAEHAMRREPALAGHPLAITAEIQNSVEIISLAPSHRDHGLHVGMSQSDARAICPDLVTRPLDPLREAAFLRMLQRWAGQFSPWVSVEGEDSLMVDISGCAHLFGGETGLAEQIQTGCIRLRLSVRVGIADTPGAAWAATHFGNETVTGLRSGDAIDQEARATRSRAHKRRNWERGGPAPQHVPVHGNVPRIIPEGQTRRALGPLPIAALRLAPEALTPLMRLGLRRVEDLATLPRAALARRFGTEVMRRLDQAFGSEPEPISPARPPHCFATRLTLPDPIGLESDILAGLDRLLAPLCRHLQASGQGARRVRFTLSRVDQTRQTLEVGLANPTQDAARIRPLLALKADQIDPGFGIEMLRLEAHVTEPLSSRQHQGHVEATTEVRARLAPGGGPELASLINRLGARLGMEALTRLHPNDSHIPEKSSTVMCAAYAPAIEVWPEIPARRPPALLNPEVMTPQGTAIPPTSFRWRRREHAISAVFGPERLAPEWWLDDPGWRSGARDYWRIETDEGLRLWVFEAKGGDISGGWFVHGNFG